MIAPTTTLTGFIDTLFHILNAEGIRYCHWKSNCNLGRSLAGLTDLDLLVDRRQSREFKQILFELNVKPILSRPGKQYSAIEDYLGFDESSGQFYHFHIHYQLILGERYVKNYRLPLEDAVLDSAIRQEGVKVTAPALETVILAIRALLKYRIRDAVKDVFAVRGPGLKRDLLDEFKYLLRKTDLGAVAAALDSAFGFIPRDIVLEFLEILSRRPRSGYRLFQLRRRLRKALAPYQRMSRLQATARYLSGMISERFGLEKFSGKKRSVAGGMHIAMIGADGSGKSTLSKELYRWLSWKLDVRLSYMGTGEQLPFSCKAMHFLSRTAGRFHRLGEVLAGRQHVITRQLGKAHRLSQYLQHIAIARMRRRRDMANRRQVGEGAIVIGDRHPLPGIYGRMSNGVPPMDGPRIAWMRQNRAPKGLSAYLARIEADIYRRISPPDYLMVLHVSPEESVRRKPDHDYREVSAKISAIENMERAGLTVIDIATEQPKEQTLLQIKKAVWELL